MPNSLLLLGLLAAFAVAFEDSDYDNNVEVTSGYEVFWSLNSTHIQLGLRVSTTGWVGFGLSETGAMGGADIVTGSVSGSTVTVVDRFAVANAKPKEDCQQDWHAVAGEEADGVTSLQLERLLDTGDEDNDVVLRPGLTSVRVICAWGSSDVFAYHGANRLTNTIDFFSVLDGNDLDTLKSDPDVGYFDVLANNYSPNPSQDTVYHRICHAVPVDNVHAIAIEHIVEESTLQYVHHFVVDAFFGTDSCDEQVSGRIAQWAWAAGTPPLVLPLDAGIPLGQNVSGYLSLALEVHYDNPDGDTFSDNSGVRIYYTENMRPNDAAMLQLGDGDVAMAGTLLATGVSKHTFQCGDCSSSYFEGNMTIFATFLHMHNFGKKIVLNQMRDGELIRTLQTEYFSFDNQANTYMDTTFTIMPGDTFSIECYYDTPGNVRFGLASSDEMCIAFLNYFPAASIDLRCGPGRQCGNYAGEDDSMSEVPRSFTQVSCSSTPTPTPTDSGTNSGAVRSGAIAFLIAVALCFF